MNRESIRRLVRIVATEKNPHSVISHVASDAQLLGLVKKIYEQERSGHFKMASEIAGFCEAHQVTLEYFLERIHLVVFTLQLADKEEDHYATLQVERTAGLEDIKAAFRRLSLLHHPDRNPGNPEAVERFMEIHRAYQVLSHARSREEYDRTLMVPAWHEAPEAEDPEPPKVPLTQKLRRLWPLTIPVLVLVVLVFFVDFQNVQTRRYYEKKRHTRTHVEGGGVVPGSGTLASTIETSRNSSHFQFLDERLARLQNRVQPPAGVAERLAALVPPVGPVKQAALLNTVPQKALVTASAPEPPPQAVPPAVETKSPQPPPGRPVQEAPSATQEPAPPRAVEAPRVAQAAPAAAPKAPDEKAVSGDAVRNKMPPEKPAAAENVREKEKTPARASKSGENVAAPAGGVEDKPGKLVKAAIPPTQETRPGDKGDAGRVKVAGIGTPEGGMREEPDAASPKERGEKSPRSAVVEPSRRVSQSPGDLVGAEELQRRLQVFLDGYAAAYRKRNSNAFFRLFEPDAVENGEPFSALQPLYVENFVRAEHIDYGIRLEKWSVKPSLVSLNGSFRLAVKFFGEESSESHGTIKMDLALNGDSFRVKKLDYQFH